MAKPPAVSTTIPDYNLIDFKKFTTAGTGGATGINLAIQTAAIAAKPAQLLLGGDVSGFVGGGSGSETVKTPDALLSDLLPKSAVTDALQATGTFSSLINKTGWQSFEAIKNSTATALVLTADSENNGDGKMTVNVVTTGTKPFAGNGAVSEVLAFNDSQGDNLVIKSLVSSANVADKKIKNGFSSDALVQSREVAFTNKDISSNYKFVTQHKFVEATNGNQALVDTTNKIYNHKDSSLKIVSNSTTAISQTYFDANGVAISNSNATTNYSYNNTSPVSDLPHSTHFDYNATQTISYNKNAIGIVTQTTTTQVPKFEFKNSDGAEINAKGTVISTTGKADTFTNAALSIKNNDYSLIVNKFVAGNFLNDLLGNASGNNSTVFSDSFTSAKMDQTAAVMRQWLPLKPSNSFNGTSHNDSITILNPNGGSVLGENGDDTIIGGAGSDTITGNSGNDVLTGGAGADKFMFSPLTTSDLDTTAGVVTDVITDFKANADTFSGFGIAGTATNYFEAQVANSLATLLTLLKDADLKLDGKFQFYVGQVGGNSYLVTDNDGKGYTDVIQLTGVKLADISFADITAL